MWRTHFSYKNYLLLNLINDDFMFFYYHTLNSLIHAIHSGPVLKTHFLVCLQLCSGFSVSSPLSALCLITKTFFIVVGFSVSVRKTLPWQQNDSSSFSDRVLIVAVGVVHSNYRYLRLLSNSPSGSRSDVDWELSNDNWPSKIVNQFPAIIIHYPAVASADGKDVLLKNRRLSENWRAHFMHNSKATKMVGKAVNLEHDKRRNLLYEKHEIKDEIALRAQHGSFPVLCLRWQEHELGVAITSSPSSRLSNWAHADFLAIVSPRQKCINELLSSGFCSRHSNAHRKAKREKHAS